MKYLIVIEKTDTGHSAYEPVGARARRRLGRLRLT